MKRKAARSGPGLEETLVIALAAGRVARAIAVDEITEGLRDRLDQWASSSSDLRSAGLRRKLAELVHCPICVGWWTSLATSLAWPGQMRLRRGAAAAGVQVLLTLAERLVSEEGRAAVHEADLVQHRSQAVA